MIYKEVVQRINPKNSHYKEFFFFIFSSLFFLFYLHEKTDVNSTYCDNHFTIYINQTMLYTETYTVRQVNYFSLKLEKNNLLKVRHSCLYLHV